MSKLSNIASAGILVGSLLGSGCSSTCDNDTTLPDAGNSVQCDANVAPIEAGNDGGTDVKEGGDENKIADELLQKNRQMLVDAYEACENGGFTGDVSCQQDKQICLSKYDEDTCKDSFDACKKAVKKSVDECIKGVIDNLYGCDFMSDFDGDEDGDGLSNRIEFNGNLNPCSKHSCFVDVSDGKLDSDEDGIKNADDDKITCKASSLHCGIPTANFNPCHK